MRCFAGLDVSLDETALCVVDETGTIVREGKAGSNPVALAEWLAAVCVSFNRIGLEAGPLSPGPYEGLRQTGCSAVCIDTRRMKGATAPMAVKTDRNDARAIAQTNDELMMDLADFRVTSTKGQFEECARRRGEVYGRLAFHGWRLDQDQSASAALGQIGRHPASELLKPGVLAPRRPRRSEGHLCPRFVTHGAALTYCPTTKTTSCR